MREKLIIIGAGGHGRVVMDAVLSNESSPYEIIGFLDDGEVEEIWGIRKLGKIEEFKNYSENYKFHIAIGNNSFRRKLTEEIGLENTATVIHKTANIAGTVKVGKGSYIGAMTVINTETEIEPGTIINTGAIVEHDCHVGRFSHLSYRVLMGSGSRTAEEIYIEMGSIINRNTKVEG